MTNATDRIEAAVTRDELARRPVAGGTLVAVVLATVAVGGAVFSFGARWGGADATASSATSVHGERIGHLAQAVEGLAKRVSIIEEIRSGLTPAVATLSAQTAKLADVVAGVRENMAAQTSEIRSLKEAVDNLRERVNGLSTSR